MGDRYVWRGGRFVNKATGEPMEVPDRPLAAPMITPTMPEYSSPIDGRMITTRHDRREDLKRNNCVESGDMSRLKGKIKNKAFAEKRGLTVSEEYR